MAKITQTFTSTTNWTVPNNAGLVNLILVGGGGGGAGGRAAGGGGAGGSGGTVSTFNNIPVTPGSTISIVVGGGGARGEVDANGTAGTSTSFAGVYTAAGGGGGTVRTTAAPGGAGAGGAGQAASGVNGGDGGNGIVVNGFTLGAGGGGGVGAFDRNTVRPFKGGESPGPGVPSAGDGGGETVNAQPGEANSGRGGGGGRSSGETTQRTTNPVVNNNPPAGFITVAAGPGGAGGSGRVIVSFDEAEYDLELLTGETNTSISGVSESGTITVRLNTRNIANGAIIPYTIGGTGITAADFSPATLTGSFTVSSTNGGQTGIASVTLTIASDEITEGTEIAVLTLDNSQASIRFNIGDFSQTALTDIESTKIRTVDYNAIRTKAINLLGSGSAGSGYGQTIKSAAVSQSSRVTVNEWANLRFDIVNIWKHQFGALPSINAPAANSIVRANTTNQPYKQYDNFVNILTANRFGIHSSQAITQNKASTSTVWPGVYGSTWTNTLFCTVTATWTSAANARYFFNSGGEIRFNSSRTGGSSTPQNSSWTTLLTSIGTRAFGANKPGQNTSPATGQNWYRLTNVLQVWETTSATSPYAANTYRILARTTDVANNSSGTSSSIEFRIEWIDGHTSDGSGSPDSVNGTVSLAVTTLEASGTYEPAGTGSFTVETPTITIGAIQPA
jgi:hypothetical protein